MPNPHATPPNPAALPFDDRPLMAAGVLAFGTPSPAAPQHLARGRLGQRNLDERCRLLTGQGLTVRHEDGRFEVDVPVTTRL